MSRLATQRIDTSGWYLRTPDKRELLVTPDYCTTLLASVKGDMKAYDTAMKNHVVSVLGADNIDPAELVITYDLNGCITSSKITNNG